jgi:hypothetical protein
VVNWGGDVTDELGVPLGRLGLEDDRHRAGLNISEPGPGREFGKPIGIAERERTRAPRRRRWQGQFLGDDGEGGRELHDRLRPPHGCRKPTSEPEESVEALQRTRDVRQEHEGSAAEHRVEALVVELELFGVAGNELDVDEVSVGRALPGHSEHLR